MMNIAANFLLLASLSGPPGQEALGDVQRSHIEANTPSPAAFSKLLDRDLLAYSRSEISKSITSVESSLLRDGPTQSGVSYPKFYVWARFISKKGKLIEGAVRVEAINRERFEVTDFVSAKDIRRIPDESLSMFPVALRKTIIGMAAKQ